MDLILHILCFCCFKNLYLDGKLQHREWNLSWQSPWDTCSWRIFAHAACLWNFVNLDHEHLFDVSWLLLQIRRLIYQLIWVCVCVKQQGTITKTSGSEQFILFFILCCDLSFPDRCGGESLEWDQCANQGFRNPNKCSECLCPLGWAPPFCDEPISSRKSQLWQRKSTRDWKRHCGLC